MSIGGYLVAAVGGALTITMFVNAGWEAPPIESVQTGYRGLGMEQNINPRVRGADLAATQASLPEPPWELDTSGDKAGDLYENVQVLGDLSDDQFNRLMTAITEWVSPDQGCAYCHNEENYADDGIYTKIVSRRMLQMTQNINANWSDHVGETGVTCYTCHRGQPVPSNIWFTDPEGGQMAKTLGNRGGQNIAGTEVGLSSLPTDPLTPFLQNYDNEIRVISLETFPSPDHKKSVKQAEWTYGLMMHMSTSLGVNCTYCHNTRSFSDWDQSTPARTTAYHGIQMARDLNESYLIPLGPEYPETRLGPLGDAPKASCATCHQGVNKPLYGAQMAKDYPSLLTSNE